MWKRYNAYLRRPPELTVDWRDPETGARGWLVINSLRGGAAGGGTRMRAGISPREVVYLGRKLSALGDIKCDADATGNLPLRIAKWLDMGLKDATVPCQVIGARFACQRATVRGDRRQLRIIGLE